MQRENDILDELRVALVHDFLLDVRGAERMSLDLCEMWPTADLYADDVSAFRRRMRSVVRAACGERSQPRLADRQALAASRLA